MPLELQVKLLRVLETGRSCASAASAPIAVDVRVIAATNRDPEQAVRDGKLREDLFYRLTCSRSRCRRCASAGGDIELLAAALPRRARIARRARRRASDPRRARPPERSTRWPGNVRELKNVVQRSFIMADERSGTRRARLARRSTPRSQAAGTPSATGSVIPIEVGSRLADSEKRLILATLEQCKGNKNEAARALGISLKTLYNRLNVYRASGAMSADAS